MNRILLFFIITIFFACTNSSTNKLNSSYTVVDSVEFNSQMTTSEYRSGLFYDPDTDEEYIYFENYLTDKKVKIFDKRGRLHTTVPLRRLLDKKVEISKLEVFNFDTIFVLESYTNDCYWLNRQGEIWKKNEFKEEHSDSLTSPIYFSTFTNSMKISRNSILVNREITPTEKLINLGKNADENNRLMMSRFWNSGRFMIADSVFSDSIICRSGFKIYKTLFPNDSTSVYIEFPRQCIKEKTLLVGSKFSNQVFELELNNFQLKRRFIVESDYTKIGMVPYSDEEDRLIMANKLTDSRNITSGKIVDIVWNKYLNHIYVLVQHQVEGSSPNVLENRPWSLIVFNDNLKKLKELKFTENNYNELLFPTPQGFLLKKNLTFKSYREQKVLLHEIVYQ